MSNLWIRTAAAAAGLVAVGLPALPSAHADDAIPDLKGVWSGKSTGGVVQGNLGHQAPSAEPRFKDTSITWTITINQQQGSGLIGTWSSPPGNTPGSTEVLIGVIRPDNKNVIFVDPDTFYSGTIMSENKLEACLQENGESMVATCYVFTRQK